MTFKFTWEMVTGICVLISLVGAGAALYVKAVVRSELSDVVTRINGTYTRAQMCNVLHDQLEQRFHSLESRLDMVENKTL